MGNIWRFEDVNVPNVTTGTAVDVELLRALAAQIKATTNSEPLFALRRFCDGCGIEHDPILHRELRVNQGHWNGDRCVAGCAIQYPEDEEHVMDENESNDHIMRAEPDLDHEPERLQIGRFILVNAPDGTLIRMDTATGNTWYYRYDVWLIVHEEDEAK